MSEPAVRLIRGDVGRKANNALTMTFGSGGDAPLATALQGAGDGAGKKLGVLFGFKNGGPGNHGLTLADGTTVQVESREQQPTVFRDGSGEQIAVAERGDSSTVQTADGAIVLSIAAHPDGGKLPADSRLPDVFRTLVRDVAGAPLADLDVIRTQGGWSLGRELAEDLIWFGHAGQALKNPLVGTAISFLREPTELELMLTLAVSVDIGIGLRPYIAEMN